MRYWGPNIRVVGDWIISSPDRNDDNLSRNPDAENYEITVQSMLRLISVNRVGTAVLNAFTTSNHSVTIRPISAAAAMKTHTAPLSVSDAAEKDYGGTHAGPGTEVTLWYIPQSKTIGNHLYRSDDTLIHECVHALRQARGVWRANPMPGWDNREEFYAIMIGNIYASVGGRLADMRSSHAKQFAALTQTDRQFQPQYNNELLDLRSNLNDVFRLIAGIDTPFNPIRVYDRIQSGYAA